MKKTAFIGILALCQVFSFNSLTYAQDKTETNILETSLKAAGGLVQSAFDLGWIVVGGKRLGSPFHEFVSGNLSSTNTISKGDIRMSGARNVPEALEELPGIVMTDLSGNGEEPTLDFRGFNQGRDLIFNLDGVRLNEPKSNNVNFPLIPVRMLEHLEVSRGGASFLYGEGALGGVANLVTTIPRDAGYHGRLESGVGSFGQWNEGFEVSDRQETYGAYVAGDIDQQTGFRQNTDIDKRDVYAKLLWDPSENSRLTLSYLYADAHLGRSGSIRQSRLTALGPRATERPNNFGDLDTNLVIAQYGIQPTEDLAVTQDLFFRQSGELSVANFATFDTDDNELDLNTCSWGGAMQVDQTHALFGALSEDILLGVEYVENDVDEEDFNRSKGTWERLAKVVDSGSEKESVGVFSKISLDWDKRLGMYYGVRYDDIEQTNIDPINAGNNAPNEVSEVSHAIGVSLKATERLALTGGYNRSFRAPNLADLYSNPSFGSNSALKPEESVDYETGLKWQNGGQLIQSTLFLNRRVNEIGFDPNLTDAIHPFGTNVNFGKTQRYGIETFMEYRLNPKLLVRGSHTYTEALFGLNTLSGAQISGDHIPMVPRNRFTSGILLEPITGLDVDLNMVAISKQVLTNDITNDRNGRRLPPYAVFNLKAVYKFRGWEFSFEVRNLLDERYEIGGSLGAAPSAFNADHTVEDDFFVPAPRRNYGGAVSYVW